jgi:hypothetical protein
MRVFQAIKTVYVWMKKLTIISVFLFTLSSFFAFSNDLMDETDDKIIEAIQHGNAKELAKFFNNTLDLNTPENEGTFSKAQAEVVMKDFFSKNPPKSFKINHQGSSNDGSHFFIGLYTTQKQNFRAYFLIKKVGEQYLIQLLQFEKE